MFQRLKNKPNHIVWFGSYSKVCPSTRYRGIYPLRHIEDEHGIGHTFVIPSWKFKHVLTFLKAYARALFGRQQFIVIQKVCSKGCYASLLKGLVLLKRGKLLYDFDDAEHLRQSPKTLHFFLKKCVVISVGSQYLAEYTKPFNKNVLLNTSPVNNHGIRKKERNTIPVIGWVGDYGTGKISTKAYAHKTSLHQLIFPFLIQQKTPLTLTLIGVNRICDKEEIEAYFSNNRNIQLNIPLNLNWEDDRWLYSEISKFDIGIAPLVEHPFNLSKSAFKAKQYISCGVPALASNIGENNSFILHNKNGALCSNTYDFEKELKRLINMDKEIYNRLSKNIPVKETPDFSIESYWSLMVIVVIN